MSNNPMKRLPKAKGAGALKHTSQLGAVDQARAQQTIQFALLAIVQQQGKVVTIPHDYAAAIFDNHRLIVEIKDGNIVLTAQAKQSNLVVPDGKIIQ